MDNEKLSIIRGKCYSSLNAGIRRLCEIETWPRPQAARRLRVGHDFYRNQMENIVEVEDLIDCLSSDIEIREYCSMDPEKPDNWRLYGFWELLLLRILPEMNGAILRRDVFNKWFNRFIKELYEPIATWRTIQSVSGLTLEVKQLRFDENTVLMQRPGFHSLQKLWGNQTFLAEGHLEPEHWGATGRDNSLIVITVRLPKKDYALERLRIFRQPTSTFDQRS